MNPVSLDQLAESLIRDGQQRPVKVRSLPDGDYELIFGHRTVEAAKIAGKETVQAIVEDLVDEDVMWAQYSENEYREDIRDYDRARWLKTMIDQFGYTQTELAEKIGQDQPWVSRHLAILKLEGIMSRDIFGNITEGQSRVILSAPEEILPDVCREIEQFYKENEDLPSASTIRDIIDWKAMDLDEIITVPAGALEPQPEAEAIHPIERPGIIEGSQADEAPAPLNEEDREYIEEHDLGWILRIPPYDVNYRSHLSKLTDEELAFCLEHETRVTSLQALRGEKRRRERKSKEVNTEVDAEVKLVQEYIAEYFSRYKQPDEDFLAWDVARRFSIPSSKAEELITDFKARRKAQPTSRRAEVEPERPSTCRCPLCERDGADKNLILMRIEDPELAQLTLTDFITEALRR